MNATFPLISAPGKSFPAESVQEMWRMVLDALRDPVFLHDRNFCITRANRAYVSRAGVGFRELIGKPYWQVFPKSTGPHRSCIQAMTNPSGPELDEIIEYDGSSFLSRSIPVTNVSGEYLYSLHIMEDISPLRQSATMVNRSEEQFRLVSEAIAEVFWMADISLERIYYVSPGYEQIWGRSRTDLYRNPRTFVDAIHPADRQRMLADLEDQKTGQAFDHVCRVIAPDETVRWIWNRGFPLADDSGHYSRYLGVALDITQRIQAEAGLLESNRRLEKIQSAMDQAGIAIQWIDADSGRFIYINERCCDMLGYSREALLTMSIPDIDPNFSKGKGDFGALTAPLRKQGAEAGSKPSRCTRTGILSRSRCYFILLSNAKEAILERKIQGGEIAIFLGQDEQSAWVSVKDNGGGIAEDILPKIFDPYFTTKKKGTGIGLYMSKMIMNHMGGGITIRNVEGGAEVLLKLPLFIN